MRGHPGGQKTKWFSRLRPGASDEASRRRPSVFDGQAESPPTGAARDYEQVRQDNLEADTRLKILQAEALEDERSLLPLRRREHELNIENAEIRRGLSLAGVVVFGSALVAGIALGIVDPDISHSLPKSLELWRLLLGK